MGGSGSAILSIHFACHRLLKVKIADGRSVSGLEHVYRMSSCQSTLILPFGMMIRHLFFREYVSRLRSPSQQHLAIRCDDSMFAFHCVFTSISPRCVLPRSNWTLQRK